MSNENSVQRRIWLAMGRVSTLFRCNTGTAWVGAGKPSRRTDGSVLLPAARPVALGLSFPDGKPVTGTHDLIGWTTIEITPQMVGKSLAVFTSIEAKNSDGGRKREDQIKFMHNLARAGGISGFASSPEEAEAVLQHWLENMREH